MTKNPHAVELGRLGGRAKSDAKTKAVRENMKKAHQAKAAKVRAVDAPRD